MPRCTVCSFSSPHRIQRLLGRPASESGRLCARMGAAEGQSLPVGVRTLSSRWASPSWRPGSSLKRCVRCCRVSPARRRQLRWRLATARSPPSTSGCARSPATCGRQDLDSTKRAGSVKIRVETIAHYLEKHGRAILSKKKEAISAGCPLSQAGQ
jgi:hypothetical protein